MVHCSPSRTLVEMYKEAHVAVNIRLVEKSNGDPGITFRNPEWNNLSI